MLASFSIDEGMNDLPFDSIPPMCDIWSVLVTAMPSHLSLTLALLMSFTSVATPSAHTLSRVLHVINHDPTFAFTYATDQLSNQAYVAEIPDTARSSAAQLLSSIKAARHKIIGAYVINMAGTPVFTVVEVRHACHRLYTDNTLHFDLLFVFALEK